MIPLADYPQLQLLAWNYPGINELPEDEAFALYEREWRWIDKNALTENEKALINKLKNEFGSGVLHV